MDDGRDAVLAAVHEALAGAAWAGVREPVVDPGCPTTGDVDVLVFDDVPALRPERRRVAAAGRPLLLDLVRLPAAALDGGAGFATQGLLLHRLMTSRPVVEQPASAAAVAGIRALAGRDDVRGARLAGFLTLGGDAVREVGITWDFPSLAILWSAIAQVASVAAMVDAAGGYCPNVYTRPLDHLRRLDAEHGTGLTGAFVAAARLDADPRAAARRLEALHAAVASRCPEPSWPPVMRAATRAEYRYFAAADELAARVASAAELAARGDVPSAVFYLRFHAVMLARLPMVARCAREGRDVSFVRPERAVARVLAEECPEALRALEAVLGGERPPDVADVLAGLEAAASARRRCLAFLRERGHDLGAMPPWAPCRPPPGAARANVCATRALR